MSSWLQTSMGPIYWYQQYLTGLPPTLSPLCMCVFGRDCVFTIWWWVRRRVPWVPRVLLSKKEMTKTTAKSLLCHPAPSLSIPHLSLSPCCCIDRPVAISLRTWWMSMTQHATETITSKAQMNIARMNYMWWVSLTFWNKHAHTVHTKLWMQYIYFSTPQSYKSLSVFENIGRSTHNKLMNLMLSMNTFMLICI